MKQLHNKIIFGFVLLIISIFTFVHVANAIDNLFQIDGDMSGGGTINITNNTTPSILSLLYKLNNENNNYLKGEVIKAFIEATYNVCANTVSAIKVSGYIESQGIKSLQSIIDNTVPGHISVKGFGTYTAPNKLGADKFIGVLEIYKTDQPFIEITKNVNGINQIDEIINNVGSLFTPEFNSYVFMGTYFKDSNSSKDFTIESVLTKRDSNSRPYMLYSQNDYYYTATYYAPKITSEVDLTQKFEIPFNVLDNTNPKTKSVKIDVYDLTNKRLLVQNDLRNTSPTIAPGTSIQLKWVATGFNNDNIVCTLPNGDPESKGTSSGLYQYIQPSKPKNTYPQNTTNYQITCTDDISFN